MDELFILMLLSALCNDRLGDECRGQNLSLELLPSAARSGWRSTRIRAGEFAAANGTTHQSRRASRPGEKERERPEKN
jgi:hypothetical protein